MSFYCNFVLFCTCVLTPVCNRRIVNDDDDELMMMCELTVRASTSTEQNNENDE